MHKFLNLIGHLVLHFLQITGNYFIFCFHAIAGIFVRPIYLNNYIRSFSEIGYYSLPVVGLTAVFTGAVLALQSYVGFSRFSAESAIANVVVLSITRELGPVMAALMVSGRVGASIAAEIATMKITEQLDALTTLATNPIKYLITPRVITSIIILPMLVIVSDIIGVMGGYLICVYHLGFSEEIYLQNSYQFLEKMDVISGLVKASVFGFIISSVGCYCGFNSTKGAQGVGSATTNAVVISSILVLLTNYLLAQVFFS